MRAHLGATDSVVGAEVSPSASGLEAAYSFIIEMACVALEIFSKRPGADKCLRAQQVLVKVRI